MYRDNSQIYLLIKRGSIKFSFVHESEIWEAIPPFLRKRFKRVRMNEWGLWLIWPWKARGYWRETCSSDFMQERKTTQKKRSNSILLPCINFLDFVKIFSRYSHLCYNERKEIMISEYWKTRKYECIMYSVNKYLLSFHSVAISGDNSVKKDLNTERKSFFQSSYYSE